MRSRTRRCAAVAATAVAVFASVPAATATAPTTEHCRAVVSFTTGSETAVLLEGHYTHPGGNADVVLTCSLVLNGSRVVSVTDAQDGPTAALASDERIGPGSFYVCHTLTIWTMVATQPIDGATESNCYG